MFGGLLFLSQNHDYCIDPDEFISKSITIISEWFKKINGTSVLTHKIIKLD